MNKAKGGIRNDNSHPQVRFPAGQRREGQRMKSGVFFGGGDNDTLVVGVEIVKHI